MEPNEADKELTKAPPIIIHSLLSVSQPVPAPGISAIMKLTQYSSLCKLLRVTALVLMFISRCKLLRVTALILMFISRCKKPYNYFDN